ncbi:MAG: anti-sigma factor, partial [Sinobacteraceae bacterium]|nr:anti-sigma factor [Nevskiaceae bacterium]
RRLTAPQRAALLAADKVAVSLEPLGGSPTGSPTGPIVIVTNVAASG